MGPLAGYQWLPNSIEANIKEYANVIMETDNRQVLASAARAIGNMAIGNVAVPSQPERSRCDCHDCTQLRGRPC